MSGTSSIFSDQPITLLWFDSKLSKSIYKLETLLDALWMDAPGYGDLLLIRSF